MQSVLNIKQKTEGQVKMEFASAQSELNRQLDILDEYIKRKEKYSKMNMNLIIYEIYGIINITNSLDYI